MANEKKEQTELKYAQWNPFFHSLQHDLDQIKAIQKVIRKDTTKMEDMFSLIYTLFSNNKPYVFESKEVKEFLVKLERKIYSPAYIKDLNSKNITPKMKLFQLRVIHDINKVYEHMITSFEAHGVMPQKAKVDKRDPNKAFNTGAY